MSKQRDQILRECILANVPADGGSIGKLALRAKFSDSMRRQKLRVTQDDFLRTSEAMIKEGVLVRGRGRGGSVTLCWDMAARNIMLGLLPEDGKAISGQALQAKFIEVAGGTFDGVDADCFEEVKNALIADGTLHKPKGRGGAIARAPAGEAPAVAEAAAA
ncbi:MAG: hypothetical protein KF778_16540 [Rhodocyclaceae bacterium]|nr:hypothetical protein [Rhodocyclaceae bacterium]MBX3670011.1 hypothetical protein [Rhodocyclaceae bacterium]